MARNKASTEEGVSSVEGATLTTTEVLLDAPAEQPAAPAPLPPKPRSNAAPLKPGVRKISLTQARAHHAAQHLGQA